MDSLYVYETKLMEQRELIKVAERRSRLLSTGAADRRSARATGFGQIVGAALAAVGRQVGRPTADRAVPAPARPAGLAPTIAAELKTAASPA